MRRCSGLILAGHRLSGAREQTSALSEALGWLGRLNLAQKWEGEGGALGDFLGLQR
jgi:hypothetical protein